MPGCERLKVMGLIYKYILLMHVLETAVWMGGYLLLALSVISRLFNKHSTRIFLNFESGFEKIGVQALVQYCAC
jgi:hypothetical protein